VGEGIKVKAERTIKEGIKCINVALKSWRRIALMKLFSSVWGTPDDLTLPFSTVSLTHGVVLRPQQEYSWMESLHSSADL
jgi:hypothetical protein